MTENEALEELKTFPVNCLDFKENQALHVATKALEEIQKYRAIGTVEQLEWCKDASHWKELFKEKLEQYEAIGTVEDIQMIFQLCKDLQVMCGKYHEIGTVEELKALKEKKKMKPLKAYDEEIESNWCSCPNCAKGIGWEYERHFNFCSECGTEFDWK